MANKLTTILCVFAFVFSYTTASAQSAVDSATFVYSVWNAEHRKAVLEHLNMSEWEKTTFAQVYDSYSHTAGLLEVQYLNLLDRYTKHASKLNDEEATKIYNQLLKNDLAVARLRKQYYKKFSKVLSPSRLNDFMAFDHSLRTMFHLQLEKVHTDKNNISEGKLSYVIRAITAAREINPGEI